MIMNKKLNILAAALATACMLTGCVHQGGGEGEGIVGHYDDIDNWSSIETGSLNFGADGKVQYNNVEVKILSICKGGDETGLELVAQQFNSEYSGKIKVTFEFEGQGSYINTLTTRIQTRVGVPTLAMFHNEDLPSLQMSHLFQPVDRVMDKAHTGIQVTDFPQQIMKNNYVADKLFGITTDSHSEVMLYRADLLEKYHLSVPKNYDELMNAAYTIQEGERAEGKSTFNGISLATESFGVFQYCYYSAIMQNGGTLLDPKTARPNWNSPDNIAAMRTATQLFKDMFYGPKAVAIPGQGEEQPDTDFVTGNCAFSFNYPWKVAEVLRTFDYKYDADDRGIASLDGLFAKDATKACAKDIYTISHGFYMPYNITDITQKAAAMEFLKYFTEHSVKWNEWGHVPASRTYYNSDEYRSSERVDDQISHFGKLENFKNFPFNYFLSCATDNLTNIFTFAMANKSSDINSLLDKYTKSANDIIDMSL